MLHNVKDVPTTLVFIFVQYQCNLVVVVQLYEWTTQTLNTLRYTEEMMHGYLLIDLRGACSISLSSYVSPCIPPPPQSVPHRVGRGDPALRSLHLRTEHHHRRHAGPGEDLRVLQWGPATLDRPTQKWPLNYQEAPQKLATHGLTMDLTRKRPFPPSVLRYVVFLWVCCSSLHPDKGLVCLSPCGDDLIENPRCCSFLHILLNICIQPTYFQKTITYSLWIRWRAL